MRKAGKILYLVIGAIVSAICWQVGAINNLRERFDDLPKLAVDIIAIISWTLLWPLVLILMVISIIMALLNSMD